MKIRLHVTGAEKLEVIDPKTGQKQIVQNLRLEPAADGHEPGTFSTTPSGVVHLNNLSEAAAGVFQVGQDYELTAIAPVAAGAGALPAGSADASSPLSAVQTSPHAT